MSRTNADRKAKIAAAWRDAVGVAPVRVWDERLPAGVAAYRVGPALVLVPELLPRAPARVRRAYRDRIVCNATGRCPRCSEVASIEAGRTLHEDGCPVLGITDSPWVDERGAFLLTSAGRLIAGDVA